jgi:hypothetical protein
LLRAWGITANYSGIEGLFTAKAGILMASYRSGFPKIQSS